MCAHNDGQHSRSIDSLPRPHYTLNLKKRGKAKVLELKSGASTTIRPGKDTLEKGKQARHQGVVKS